MHISIHLYVHIYYLFVLISISTCRDVESRGKIYIPFQINDDWNTVQRSTDKDLWNSSLIRSENSKPLKIRFNEPAKHWTDAVPIGNGRLGAMIWGGVANETLNLNEDTLWTGIPANYTNPNAPNALSDVRKLVDDRQFSQATTAAVNLSGLSSEAYQILGDMNLEFDESHASYDEKSYHRELDLDTATVKVKYSVGEIEFTREHFSSNPDQVIATKISANKPKSISFTVSLTSKQQHTSQANSQNQIIMNGICPGKDTEHGFENGIKFTSILNLQISDGAGEIKFLDDGKLKVEGADYAVILLVASSSFDGPFIKPSDSKKDPNEESLTAINSIKVLPYSDLHARHLLDYRRLFHRVSLQIWKNGSSVLDDEKVSSADRVRSFGNDEDPSFVEVLFQYGRYLLISCSRPGTQVANLQGIWSKDVYPPWEAAPHLNINLQMNYWPSLSCNLQECQQPLFDYISSLSINGKKTAKVNYKASGWVAHQVSDIWAKTSPDRGEAVWALWPMGGAWLTTHLWEHYTFTMDQEFLEKKEYPLMEGCASFLLDWLIQGKGGLLETNPSTSPEHMFTAPDGKPASVSYSSTMDMSIIKEVFSAVVSAAQVLGKSKDVIVERIRNAQPRLYPTNIAKDGSIMEWAEDFEDPDVHHRHVSHLFGLFPGHTITVEETPELCKAANHTLYKRGVEGPGWSTTWKAALWARLHNSENAYRMIKHLINLVDPDREGDYEGGLYSNLFTAHPPFQIDANFGFAAAVSEMLLQSTVKDLYLLPALPRDKWANGCVKGLKARGGVTVSICWSEGDLHEFGIWSNIGNSIKRLHYRGNIVTAEISSGIVYTFDKFLNCIDTYSLVL